MHIFPNNKVYVGITCRKPKYRWDNGNGYKNNKYMTNAIQKYGWNNIEHKILFTDLMKEEAERKEIELIATLNTLQTVQSFAMTGCTSLRGADFRLCRTKSASSG